jgi:hypothetical protein
VLKLSDQHFWWFWFFLTLSLLTRSCSSEYCLNKLFPSERKSYVFGQQKSQKRTIYAVSCFLQLLSSRFERKLKEKRPLENLGEKKKENWKMKKIMSTKTSKAATGKLLFKKKKCLKSSDVTLISSITII